ncbi:MAG TPA: hypothetical protein GXZ48_06130 [Acholeplasmataceae bacterium]|jgi:hypothetical protein|nr:hypothetical protein [Acholeplasmataceae bacterium]
MGNQASFISTSKNSDLDKIISLFEKYNIRTADDEMCSCCAKVTLNKQIRLTIDEVWGSVGNNKTFKKGKQFLLLVGERCCQRDIEDMFDMENIQYNDKELDLIYSIDIIFADYFPTEKMFEDIKYATIEDLDVCTQTPDEKYLAIATEIAEELKIKGKPIEQCKKQVKEVCDRYGMNLTIEDWVTTNTFSYDESIQDYREVHDSVTNLIVDDIFYFQIEVPENGGEIRYFVNIDKTLIRKIANFLSSKDK